MLTTNKEVLDKANSEGYAVGAFNINNMEILEAIIWVANELKSPVIIQTTEGAIEYAGVEFLASLVKTAAEVSSVPITLHLDHGKHFEMIKKCIDAGYTSVMIDGSHLDFEGNVSLTKQVVDYAHPKGVSVEGELGTIGGVEDNVSAKHILYTAPDAASMFVSRTGVDALAIAIGTSHGAYKFKGKSKLDFKRLQEIKEQVKVPLVLHGASGIPQDIVKQANKYGAKIKGAKGVADKDIQKAVEFGINKVNIDSDLRLAFTAAVRKTLADKPEEFDPRKILGPARNLISDVVKHKMQLLGSAGKA